MCLSFSKSSDMRTPICRCLRDWRAERYVRSLWRLPSNTIEALQGRTQASFGLEPDCCAHAAAELFPRDALSMDSIREQAILLLRRERFRRGLCAPDPWT